MNSIANEIYPNLWLGDIHSATNVRFLKEKGINCIINCTESLPFPNLPQIIKKYRVAVKDNLQPDQIYKLYTYLDVTVTKMYNLLKKGNKILVHCHARKQRSVAIIIAFLMKYAQLSKEESILLLRTKRDIAGLPVINFDKALAQYESDLRGQ